MSSRSLVLAGVLSGLLFGCTVADYESKMLQSQIRLQKLDEYAASLDQALQIPPRDDKKGPIAKLYLRPPKGISQLASNPNDPRLRLFYTYPARQGNPPPAIQAVELAIGHMDKDFPKEVVAAFTPSAEPKRYPRNVQSPLRDKPITFQTFDFSDGQFFYSVNLWRGDEDRAQVAIVYRAQLGQRPMVERQIALSLETFGFGKEADRMFQILQAVPLMPPLHPPHPTTQP
jgi:hypothetical protein